LTLLNLILHEIIIDPSLLIFGLMWNPK